MVSWPLFLIITKLDNLLVLGNYFLSHNSLRISQSVLRLISAVYLCTLNLLKVGLDLVIDYEGFTEM